MNRLGAIFGLIVLCGALLATSYEQVNTTSTQTLTNKTLTAPVLSGTVTGTYTLGGTPTISGATFSSPVFSGSVTGTYTLAGTPTLTSPTITGGSYTSGNLITPILNTATFSGTATGTYTLAGTPTITAPAISNPTLSGGGILGGSYTGTYTLAGTPTITAPAISAPVFSGTATGTYTLAGTPTITAPAISNPVLSGTATGTYTLGGTPSLATINLTGGQIAFPATQAASANANTLDDYEEGTWTPVITFGTPGNLSVSYASQEGHYIKVGRHVTVWFRLQTSAFTHTTASGNLTITGAPFTGAGVVGVNEGTLRYQGITKANFTQFTPELFASSEILVVASGSAQTTGNVTFSDVPTGGTVILHGTITFDAGT